MNFNSLIPELSVSSFQKSIDFYTKIIGFVAVYERENFAFLSLDRAQIMIQKVNKTWNIGELKYPYGRGINFQIVLSDLNPILQRLNKNNYKLFEKVKINKYKIKNKIIMQEEFLIQDPDGYLLRFCKIK